MPSSPCAHLQSTADTIRCLVPTILIPQTIVLCLINFCVILDSRREVDEIYSLLEYCAAYSGNSLPIGCRNVGKKLLLCAA